MSAMGGSRTLRRRICRSYTSRAARTRANFDAGFSRALVQTCAGPILGERASELGSAAAGWRTAPDDVANDLELLAQRFEASLTCASNRTLRGGGGSCGAAQRAGPRQSGGAM